GRVDSNRGILAGEVGNSGGDLLPGLGGEWLEVDHRALRQRVAQLRPCRLSGGAQQPERRFRLDVERDVPEPDELLLAVEDRPTPDVNVRLGTETEPTLAFVCLDPQRHQQAIA